jgi:hypothetical protein
MKKLNENETRVIFKKRLTSGDIIRGDIFACLLDVPADKYKVVTYQHIGQHGEDDIYYCSGCKAATPEEYAPLLKELKSIGYIPIIRKKFTYK